MSRSAFDRVWTQVFLPADVRSRVEDAFGSVVAGLEGPYRSVLLTGEAGCGKTALLRCLAQECDIPLVSAGFDWVWKPPPTDADAGDSQPVYARNLSAIFAKARTAAPSILSFDETEVSFPSPEATGANAMGAVRNSRTPELVGCFLVAFDRLRARKDRVLLTGATFEPFGVDAAVRRRFDIEIELPFPDESARSQILAFALRQMQIEQRVPDAVVAMTAGWSGHRLFSLAREVVADAMSAAKAVEADTWIETIQKRARN